jgi:hypothetical protein
MHRSTTYTRRDLLKLGVIGAAALGLAGTLPALRNVAAPQHVGLLLPETRLYPQLGAELLTGLRNGLARRGSAIGLVSGATLTELLAAGADLIVAATSPARAQPVQAQARAAGREFIVVGAGEALPEPGMPYVGLGYWQASWAAGRQAVQQFGPRITTIASAYESGFDSFYAFQLGAAAAGGAVDAPLLVGPGLLSAEEALRTAATRRPDALYVAADHATSLRISATAGATPVVAGSFSALAGPLPAYRATTWVRGSAGSPFALLGDDVAAFLIAGTLPERLHRPIVWRTPDGGDAVLEAVPEAAICAACVAGGPRARWTNAYLSL